MTQKKDKVILIFSAVNSQDCLRCLHELEEKTVISINQRAR